MVVHAARGERSAPRAHRGRPHRREPDHTAAAHNSLRLQLLLVRRPRAHLPPISAGRWGGAIAGSAAMHSNEEWQPPLSQLANELPNPTLPHGPTSYTRGLLAGGSGAAAAAADDEAGLGPSSAAAARRSKGGKLFTDPIYGAYRLDAACTGACTFVCARVTSECERRARREATRGPLDSRRNL